MYDTWIRAAAAQRGWCLMAASKEIYDTKLLVVVETGETKNGKAVTKNLSFSKIRVDATGEQLLAAGAGIASLQSHALSTLRVNELYDLKEEA